jgi:cytosine/adenosine deaminase-related metal-dependent hydrolase
MIIRARTVVTMNGAPIENGAVAVSGNRIVDVGAFDEIKARNAGNHLDLAAKVLLPGLINAHCHLDYTCLRGKIPPQDSFTDWIRAINAEKSELSPKDYLASINDGLQEAKRFGTTAIANLTAFPESISQIRPPIRTWWFAELIDIRAPERADEFVDSTIDALRSSMACADTSASATGRIRRGEPSKRSRSRRIAALQKPRWGLAPHAMFTASKHLFRRCEEIAQKNDILLTTHLAESREEMEMFRDASGPLYEFIKSIGRPMNDCGNETPLELFIGALGDRALPEWIVVHLNELTESDFDLLERSNPKFQIVHCPRSHNYFGHSPFAFERLRSLGFNVCLGTDSLASNQTLSLFDEMRHFQKNFPNISPNEILKLATVNPARALRYENALGQIRPGFRADLIAVPSSGSTDVFEQIIACDAPVSWSMVNGQGYRDW